jgi:hypothetical protein
MFMNKSVYAYMDIYVYLYSTYYRIIIIFRYNRRLIVNSTAPTLNNPIVCLVVGASIIFDVSSTKYPVYIKDSLLNTNPDFDYTPFRYI